LRLQYSFFTPQKRSNSHAIKEKEEREKITADKFISSRGKNVSLVRNKTLFFFFYFPLNHLKLTQVVCDKVFKQTSFFLSV
jgi:hypothetical protein